MADDEFDPMGLSSNEAVGIMGRAIRETVVPLPDTFGDNSVEGVVAHILMVLAEKGIVVAKPLVADVRDFYPGQRRVVVAAPAEYLRGLHVNAPGL